MRPQESNSDLFVHSSGVDRVPEEAQPIIHPKATRQEATAQYPPMAGSQFWHCHAGRNHIHTCALLSAGPMNSFDAADFRAALERNSINASPKNSRESPHRQ